MEIDAIVYMVDYSTTEMQENIGSCVYVRTTNY